MLECEPSGPVAMLGETGSGSLLAVRICDDVVCLGLSSSLSIISIISLEVLDLFHDAASLLFLFGVLCAAKGEEVDNLAFPLSLERGRTPSSLSEISMTSAEIDSGVLTRRELVAFFDDIPENKAESRELGISFRLGACVGFGSDNFRWDFGAVENGKREGALVIEERGGRLVAVAGVW